MHEPAPHEPAPHESAAREPAAREPAQPTPGRAPRAAAPAGARERSPWHWLLLLPIAVPLATPLYNRVEPRLFGLPAFYWLQLAFILLGVGTTTLVYRVTVRRMPRRHR